MDAAIDLRVHIPDPGSAILPRSWRGDCGDTWLDEDAAVHAPAFLAANLACEAHPRPPQRRRQDWDRVAVHAMT